MLFSLRQQWTKALLRGEKTVELRRARSGCEPGTPLLIYTSHPVKRVQARATVTCVHAFPPQALWERVGNQSAVAHEEFFAYLGDLEVAYGIELTDITELAPLALERAGPQSWRYLFADEPEGATVLAHAGLRR